MTRAEEVVAGLHAPFDEKQIRWVPKGNGMTAAYITARMAMNRLDEVVGPENWFDEYEPISNDGLKCRLFVRFAEGEGFMSKCGIGGYADMKDDDDAEKSAESSAFKRAAVKFGIGRYLYNDGVPGFCGDCPMPRKDAGRQVSAPSRPAAASAGPRPAPAQSRPAPQQPRYTDQSGGRTFDNFKIPPPGKAVFAWSKRIGDHYGVDLIPGMREAGKNIGAGTDFTRWDEDAVVEIASRTINHIKSLGNYDGKFDHIDTGDRSSGSDKPDSAPWGD